MAMIIPLGQQLPAASSDATRERRAGHSQMFSYLVLLRMGFTMLFRSPGKRWALTSPFHPYPTESGGIFSVALSLESPPVVISDHPALWSSDFPPVCLLQAGDHLIHSNNLLFYKYNISLLIFK